MKEYKVEVDNKGNIFWRNLSGLLHREEGPAIEYSDGTWEWCQNGKLHREDGPAVVHKNGSKQWWTNGKLIAFTKPKTLILTPGKFYKSKDGEKWCCFDIVPDAEEHHAAFCIRTRDHRVEYFYIDGRYDTAGLREHTLIAEWVEPSDLAKDF